MTPSIIIRHERADDMTDTRAALWDEFLASGSAEAAAARGATYTSWQFGLGSDMADSLLAPVLDGGKRATAGSLLAYELEPEPVPVVGEYSVILDGRGTGRCIIRTTSVEIVPFDEVDAEHARLEGEGDLSLEYWRASHWAYYTRELAGFGRTPEADMPIVCERFEVVHLPRDAADRTQSGERSMESPVLNTDRLTIDGLRPGDAEALFAYRGDPDVSRYQEWAPGSVEDAERFIRSVEATAFDTPGTWSQLAIRERGSGRLLGDLGVHFLEDGRQVEIGYTLAPESQGSGLASEAVIRLLDHLFRTMDKHRVSASVDPSNEPSIRLLTCVGMRQEAHFRASLWFKGEWADDLVFAVLQTEWPHPTPDRDPR